MQKRFQKTLDTYEQTKDKALNLLEFRAHSEKELCDKLKRYGAKEEYIEETLDFCRRYGFVNDEQYAMRKARDLKKLKKYGYRRIVSELKSLGIDDEIICCTMQEFDDDDTESLLLPLVRKKLNGDFEKKSTDRCIRYFIYRGYEIRDITGCISTVKEENQF